MHVRLLSTVTLVLLASTSYAGDGTPNSVVVCGGTLNGQLLTRAESWVTVEPGAAIRGTISVETYNSMGPGAVAPLGYTATWGDRELQAVCTVRSIPPGHGRYDLSVNKTAPRRPGEYFLVIAFAGRYDIAQVMSATTAGIPAKWHDGNDLGWDWDSSQFGQALRNGRVQQPTRKKSRMKVGWAAATWVGVRVCASADTTSGFGEHGRVGRRQAPRQGDPSVSQRIEAAVSTFLELRRTTNQFKRDQTYRGLVALGKVQVRTANGTVLLQDIARQRLYEVAPILRRTGALDDPALLVTALVFQDTKFFLSELTLLQIDGEWVSVTEALRRTRGVDPAVALALVDVVEGVGQIRSLDRPISGLERVTAGLGVLARAGMLKARWPDHGGQTRRPREPAASQSSDRGRQLHREAAANALGLAVTTLDSTNRAALGIPPDMYGVVIKYVQPGSPGAESGLRAGQVINSIKYRVNVGPGREKKRVNLSVHNKDRFLGCVSNVARVLKTGDQVVLLIWQKDSRGTWALPGRTVRLK